MDDDTAMRILLVEDEPSVRAFLVRALAHAAPGFEVEALADGRQALGAFTRRPADLVISDHHMPAMTGVDLLRAIRAVSAVPFVLISADRSVEPAARAAGCSCFLGKPLLIEELRAVVADLAPRDPLY